MNVVLPSVVFRGEVKRVHSINAVDVILDLRLGVHIEKRIVLEGIEPGSILPQHRNNAMKCLIRLLGGKSVLVHTDDSQRDGYILGRIFLTDKIENPPVPLRRPYDMDVELLEVSSFYSWLASKNFDLNQLSFALDGKVK